MRNRITAGFNIVWTLKVSTVGLRESNKENLFGIVDIPDK